MSKAEEAAAWAKAIAYDDSHGYDQGSRWGPDYDCSSLVISAWEAVGVPVRIYGASYTGNMRSAFLAAGFQDVTAQIQLGTGAGLIAGDVLLNVQHHTAICIGGGQLVNAGGNESGGVTGGLTGDQTGREIRVMGYYNFPWDHVLRSTEQTAAATVTATAPNVPPAGGTRFYTVRSGDMLGLIAMAHGTTIQELAALNNLADPNRIYPGQVLILPGGVSESDTKEEPAATAAPGSEEERISALARDVIAGKYGNGIVRVLKLGADYEAVQAEVNRLLAGI